MKEFIKNGSRPSSPVESCIIDNSGDYIGLTKREHFAGLALQGLLANSYGDSWSDDQRVGALTKQAIGYADEILNKLDK